CVHNIAGGRPFAFARVRVERDERLARVDADSEVQIEPLVLGVELRERATDAQCRPDGAFGFALVSARRAEKGEDGVAPELLERAAVPLELGADAGRVRRDEGL